MGIMHFCKILQSKQDLSSWYRGRKIIGARVNTNLHQNFVESVVEIWELVQAIDDLGEDAFWRILIIFTTNILSTFLLNTHSKS